MQSCYVIVYNFMEKGALVDIFSIKKGQNPHFYYTKFVPSVLKVLQCFPHWHPCQMRL